MENFSKKPLVFESEYAIIRGMKGRDNESPLSFKSKKETAMNPEQQKPDWVEDVLPPEERKQKLPLSKILCFFTLITTVAVFLWMYFFFSLLSFNF